MNVEAPLRIEKWVSVLLEYGSRIASATIALGLAAAFFGAGPGIRIATAGIALMILLPVARVAVMLVLFVRERDYKLALTAMLVLAVILAGIAIGLRSASGSAG